jgi:hypothetical protein
VRTQVRRDNCLLVKEVVGASLNKLLIDRDAKGAVEYVKGMISDLLMHKVDLSMLVRGPELLREEHRDGETENSGPPEGSRRAHSTLRLALPSGEEVSTRSLLKTHPRDAQLPRGLNAAGAYPRMKFRNTELYWLDLLN